MTFFLPTWAAPNGITVHTSGSLVAPSVTAGGNVKLTAEGKATVTLNSVDGNADISALGGEANVRLDGPVNGRISITGQNIVEVTGTLSGSCQSLKTVAIG